MGSSLPVVRPHPLWGNLVNDVFRDDLPALFEAGDAVESVQLHPGWGHVQHLLRAEIRSIEATLEDGLLPDRASYARAHGRLSGLRAAGLAAEAILSRAQARFIEQQKLVAADRSATGE